MNISNQTTVSVKEARKLLGKDASKMSDEEIALTVESLEEVASFLYARYTATKCVKVQNK